ncbi:MAG: hypothetical protein LYZ70_01110 [Nitrososphaerales archaeon]|nr:hypothetical protein [Nitrososphaerales archaeon]
MSLPEASELLFVVGVSSFTKRGFMGTTSFNGKPIEMEFDDSDGGVFLSREMCRRIRVRKGSKVKIMIEGETSPRFAESVVAGVREKVRISNAKVYYEVGREGGAIIRLRKG